MPNEQPTELVRPTKKQRELLEYIASFIAEHGYSPSYREIMAALNYNSVATVALHVNNLIKRGHLVKRDYSARSLEVVALEAEQKPLTTNYVKISDEKWLVDNIEQRFKECEQDGVPKSSDIDALYVLVGALRVLGIDGAAQSFMPRLHELKQKLS
jgi:SOS-response transcriptional repressor LexA